MRPALSIIVPSRNESDNLKRLIPELVQTLSVLGDAYEVIVVDNGSTDATQETLQELTSRYPRVRSVYEGERGFGRALLCGLHEGQGEVLGYIHADNQMSPREILRIYEKLKKDNLAVCKARRIHRNDGAWRYFISKVYNALFRLMFKVNLKDINGSPKLFTKTFFEGAKLSSLDWFIDPEIIIRAKQLGAAVGELDIHTFRRESGVSQVRLKTILEFCKNMLRYWRGGGQK
ncbi:MAG: glycosyltransferase family 2 protein [Patescibacteria group bacterium]